MDARLKLALDTVPSGVRYADIRLVEWEKEEIYIKNGKVVWGMGSNLNILQLIKIVK